MQKYHPTIDLTNENNKIRSNDYGMRAPINHTDEHRRKLKFIIELGAYILNTADIDSDSEEYTTTDLDNCNYLLNLLGYCFSDIFDELVLSSDAPQSGSWFNVGIVIAYVPNTRRKYFFFTDTFAIEFSPGGPIDLYYQRSKLYRHKYKADHQLLKNDI